MSTIFKMFTGLFALALVFTGCFALLQVVMYWELVNNPATSSPSLPLFFPGWTFRGREWIMNSLENYLEDPEMITIVYDGEVYSGPGGVPSSMPVAGSIFCDYGDNVRCANGYIYRHHTGIDVPVPTGTDVHTTIAGTVVYAGWQNDYGNLVVVQNGKVQTWYAHNSQIDVSVGQFVQQGLVIAQSGSTGSSTGPHVHYEVRVGGKSVDPRSLQLSGGGQ